MSRLPRTELLLALACAAAAAMLAASQFTDMFHLIPPGGEALEARTSEDQHGYAMLVLAVLSLVLLAVALSARPGADGLGLRKVASFGVAAAGVVALLLFLTIDLPDVNKIGTLDDERGSFIDAKAEPQAGFWLELIGSAVLAACGVGLATMREPADSSDGSAEGPRRPYAYQR